MGITRNNTLRIITEGAFSSPILAIQMLTRIDPLSYRRKIGAQVRREIEETK